MGPFGATELLIIARSADTGQDRRADEALVSCRNYRSR